MTTATPSVLNITMAEPTRAFLWEMKSMHECVVHGFMVAKNPHRNFNFYREKFVPDDSDWIAEHVCVCAKREKEKEKNKDKRNGMVECNEEPSRTHIYIEIYWTITHGSIFIESVMVGTAKSVRTCVCVSEWMYIFLIFCIFFFSVLSSVHRSVCRSVCRCGTMQYSLSLRCTVCAMLYVLSCSMCTVKVYWHLNMGRLVVNCGRGKWIIYLYWWVVVVYTTGNPIHFVSFFFFLSSCVGLFYLFFSLWKCIKTVKTVL